jgi:hypothetical protein
MATQTTQTETVLPEWYTQYAKNVLSKAYSSTSEPYMAYAAPRIAGFQPEQEQAFSGYKASMGEYQPYISASQQALGAGTGSFTQPGVAQQYMNPYIQNVVSGIGAMAGRNLYENILPAVNRTFVGGGTFGGSRSAEFTQRAIRDAQAGALSAQVNAMQEGYNKAADLYGNEAGRALQAAPLFAQLGTQAQTQRINELKGLEAIGLQRQGLAQTSADLAYEDFQRQRDYPYSQVERLAAIGGQPRATGAGTETVTGPGQSKTSQIIGGLATGAGILAKTGAFGTGGWLGLKDGGSVKKKEQRGLGWLKG